MHHHHHEQQNDALQDAFSTVWIFKVKLPASFSKQHSNMAKKKKERKECVNVSSRAQSVILPEPSAHGSALPGALTTPVRKKIIKHQLRKMRPFLKDIIKTSHLLDLK